MPRTVTVRWLVLRRRRRRRFPAGSSPHSPPARHRHGRRPGSPFCPEHTDNLLICAGLFLLPFISFSMFLSASSVRRRHGRGPNRDNIPDVSSFTLARVAADARIIIKAGFHFYSFFFPALSPPLVRAKFVSFPFRSRNAPSREQPGRGPIQTSTTIKCPPVSESRRFVWLRLKRVIRFENPANNDDDDSIPSVCVSAQ